MPRALPPAHPELPEPSSGDSALMRSFNLHVRSEGLSPRTVDIYMGAARLLARWSAGHLDHGLEESTREDVKTYVVWMRETARKRNGEPYSKGYVNNQFRAVQAFYKWMAEDEDIPNPMIGMKPPKVDDKVVDVLSDDQIDGLLVSFEKKNDHDSRRNYAIIRLFLYSGIRLAEMTGIKISDVDLENGKVVVTGKGDRQRTVKFDARTGKALDRYLRVRAKHKLARLDDLWLGSNHRLPLTPNGMRQAIRKTAQELGFHMYPHMFRHSFAHRWLDAGGAEGDLMELMGWKSPQMLRRYGASARSARAQRSYDRNASLLMGGR